VVLVVLVMKKAHRLWAEIGLPQVRDGETGLPQVRDRETGIKLTTRGT
jgi:hypothetical protein